ncbi:MAG: phosphotransferase [Cyanobacteria bacterium P01_A01_bin.40]
MLLKPWKSFFYGLLCHPTEAKVLLLSRNEAYHLPYAQIDGNIWFDDLQTIKNAVEQELNISVNVLHYASYQIDKKQHRIKGIYILEQHNPREEIQVGIWCDRATLASLSFDDPEQKSILEAYLIERESGEIPLLRPPWAQPVWFSEASAWIEEQLEKLNYRQIAPIEYVRSWSMSCVLRIKTTAGNIYFKTASTLPLFCNEPIVTAELASLFPLHIPTVIAIERQHHWMLLADFGKSIGSKASFKVRQDIYRSLAQLQIQSVSHRDRLLAVGCLDRRLDILQSQIEPLINDQAALAELSAAEIECLHTLAPKLKQFCSQLASYNIPETLVHGDLHLHNVARVQDNYLFFDWTDSCISHPFFDLFELFLNRNQKSFVGRLTGWRNSKFKEQCRDRYLSQWTQYESSERLLNAWNIAKPLCALHHAVTYQKMSHSLEARTKQEINAVPYFIRAIIA